MHVTPDFFGLVVENKFASLVSFDHNYFQAIFGQVKAILRVK